MNSPRSATKTPQVVLFTLDDVPAAGNLREAIPTSDLVRRCAHYGYLEEHQALAALMYAVPEPALEDGVADNILAVDSALVGLFVQECVLELNGGLSLGFHPGLDVSRAAELLTEGGFKVVLYADIMRQRLTPHGRDEFLAGVITAFEASIPAGSARASIVAFLRGETTVVPGAALRDVKRAEDRSVSRVCQVALGPIVERWHPEIAGRVLDLWVAARGPFDRLSFENDNRERGADRSGLLTTALLSRGVHPAIAFLSGAPWWSRSFLAVSRLPQGSALLSAAVALDASAAENDARTAPDVAYALFDVRGLARMPLVKELAITLLTSAATPPEALQPRALWRAVKTFGAPLAKKITSAQLVASQAQDRSGSTMMLFALAEKLAQLVPKVHGDALRAVTERWLASVKALDATVLEALTLRTKEAEVAWPHVVRLLEHDPKNASSLRAELLPALHMLRAPPAAEKKRLAALCAEQAKALGPRLLQGLSKLAGVAITPPPGAAADLESSPAATQAKAWKAAREQNPPSALKNLEALLRHRVEIREMLASSGVTEHTLHTHVGGRSLSLNCSIPYMPFVSREHDAQHQSKLEARLREIGMTFESRLGHVKFEFVDARGRRGVELAFRIVSTFKRFFTLCGVSDEAEAGRPKGKIEEAEEVEILEHLEYRSIRRGIGGIIVDGYESCSSNSIIGEAVNDIFRTGDDAEVELLLDVLGAPIEATKVPDAQRVRDELRKLLGTLARPRKVLSLRPPLEDAADLRFVSHFHGEPYFEQGEAWPCNAKSKRPLSFVCQLVADGSLPLPAGIGILQLFYDEEMPAYQTKDPGWLVKTYPAIRRPESIRVARPPGLPDKRCLAVEAQPDGSLPTYGEIAYPLRTTRKGERVEQLCEQLDPLVPEDAFTELAQEWIAHPEAWTFMGGHPRWVQDEALKRGYELLLQCGSHPDHDLDWGDSGAIYLFRHQKTGKFDFVLQSQ